MKLHGITLIKNEADFIERSLRDNASFFDHIYVYDNGSTDGTWEIVQKLAEELPEVVAFKSEDRDFRDGLRAVPYNHFKDRAERGDWWCRLDGDEIYIDDPREFLREVPASHHVVWSCHLQYYFTEEDAERWESGEVAPQPDFSDMPRRYVSNASEGRFFRHRPGLEWGEANAWPTHMGIVTPKRIRLKHFQWRSPKQIQDRLDTRREAAERGYRTFLHTIESDWREKIQPADELHRDALDGTYEIDEHLLPNHLEPGARRLLKGICHRLNLWP